MEKPVEVASLKGDGQTISVAVVGDTKKQQTDSDQQTDEHQLAPFVLPGRLQRLGSVLEQRTRSLTLVMDRVHNQHNISAVIRTADAFGLQEIHFIGDKFDYSGGITLGAERWIDILEHECAAAAAVHLRNKGYSLVVLQPEDPTLHNEEKKSVPVYELPFQDKLALVFGNERDGVSKEFRELADVRAHIPMFGFVESLNISVTAAICLFCSTIRGAHSGRHVQLLSEEEKEELRDCWLRQDVKGAELILERLKS